MVLLAKFATALSHGGSLVGHETKSLYSLSLRNKAILAGYTAFEPDLEMQNESRNGG
jgi:hypothetical protein